MTRLIYILEVYASCKNGNLRLKLVKNRVAIVAMTIGSVYRQSSGVLNVFTGNCSF